MQKETKTIQIPEQEEQTKEIFSILDELTPAAIPANNLQSVEADIVKESRFLDSFYLFHLKDINITKNVNNYFNFITERIQTLLSACYKVKVTFAYVIKGNKNGIEIYFGFRSDSSEGGKIEIYKSFLDGILPSDLTTFKESCCISNLSEGLEHGGIICGIPVLWRKNKKYEFNLSSIVRSMYGKKYVLTIMSRPVEEKNIVDFYHKFLKYREKLYAIAQQTISRQHGTTDTTQTTEGKTTTHGVTVGGAIPFKGIILGLGYQYSKSKSKSTSKGHSEHESEGITYQLQNAMAVELLKFIDRNIQKLNQGLHSGLWDTTITFATEGELDSNVLANVFVAELSKPVDELFIPPRYFIGNIKSGNLPLPKTYNESVYPKFSSCLTTEEVAMISSPPHESLPGFEVKKVPSLALSDPESAEDNIILGEIVDKGISISKNYFTLSKLSLNKHIFVCGVTGSGKSTTVKNIIKQAVLRGIPILVIESAKKEYRGLFGDEELSEKLKIFTIGDPTVSPVSFNPFYVQKGVHLLNHIDSLKAIFNASFSLYGPMPHIVEKALINVYLKKGWDITTGIHPYFLNEKGELDESKYENPEHYYLFPILEDLKDEVDNYVKNQLEYEGELKDNIRTAIVVRLESLCQGAKGLLFNTYEHYSIYKLLQENVIFELDSLTDDDDKAFFIGLILAFISEYRQVNNPAINLTLEKNKLSHILVIEEAHRLLKNVTTERISEMMGNPKGKAVEIFCNMISEMRSAGQGVIVVEQIPSKITPDVIKNSNTKIVHRLVSRDDQILMAGSLGLSEDDTLYLNNLKTGRALCFKEGMEKPAEVQILDNIKTHAVEDIRIKKVMSNKSLDQLHPMEVYILSSAIRKDDVVCITKFLNSLVTVSENKLNELLNLAKQSLKKLLVLKGIKKDFNDAIINEYLSLRLMEFFTKGLYAYNFQLPENLKKLLSELLKGDDLIILRNELLNLLEKMWGKKPEDYVSEVIENLVKNHFLRRELSFNYLDVYEAVKSCFFIYDEDYVDKIYSKIIYGGD